MNNDEWLKLQCNKYINGVCSTLSCVLRGYKLKIKDRNNIPLPIDFSKSTCESHEILLELQELRDKNFKLMNNKINNL
mgnify:CR=1 FL=1